MEIKDRFIHHCQWLSCHDFDSLEQNEKGLDVVVGIDMLLVMMFHPPQGVTMIEMMPTYFNTEHHGKKMRRISALQLLEPGPKTHVRGKIMSVSRLIDRHVKFPLCVMGDTIKVEGWHCIPSCPDVVYEQPGKSTWIVNLHTMQLFLNLQFAGAKTDGSMTPIKSFTKIKDPRPVYSDSPVKHIPISKTHTRKKKRSNASEWSVWKCSAKFGKDARRGRDYRSSRTRWKHTHTIILYTFQPTQLASECYAIGYGPNKSTHRRIGVTTNSPTKGRVEMVQLNS